MPLLAAVTAVTVFVVLWNSMVALPLHWMASARVARTVFVPFTMSFDPSPSTMAGALVVLMFAPFMVTVMPSGTVRVWVMSPVTCMSSSSIVTGTFL